jgi:hypothetical protein
LPIGFCLLQTARDCLQLLYTLVNAWLVLLRQQELLLGLSSAGGTPARLEPEGHGLPGASSALEEYSGNPGAAAGSMAYKGSGSFSSGLGYSSNAGLDLHRLEGVMFMLLCSNDHLLRRDAFFLMRLLRQLHQELCKASIAGPVLSAGGASSPLKAAAAAGNTLRARLLASKSVVARSAAAAGGGGASGVTGELEAPGPSTTAASGASSHGGVLAGSRGSSLSATAAGGAGGGLESLLAMAGNAADSTASGSSNSTLVPGMGFFSRHRQTMSRESLDFLPSFGEKPLCIIFIQKACTGLYVLPHMFLSIVTGAVGGYPDI